MTEQTKTPAPPATDAKIVTFTVAAQREVAKIIANDPTKKGMGLRLGVKGGGCSGFSYHFDFDTKRENDHVLSFGDFEAYIDLKSAIYLKGLMVDFQGGLSGKGFVFRNPNATNTCGCGESFSI